MLNLKGILESEVIILERMLAELKTEMEASPKGSLTWKTVNGKGYTYHCVYELSPEGVLRQRQQRVAINDAEIVRKISRRKFLEGLEGTLETNVSAVKKLMENYVPINKVEINNSLPVIYRRRENLYGDRLLDQETHAYRESGRKHKTTSGVRVRSKSEALIIEILERHLIPFEYEREIVLDDVMYLPDFIVTNIATGEEYLWEHFGMLSDEKYAERMEKKLAAYRKNGYVVNKNLILTYDDSDGNIDLGVIERIINAYLK